MPKLPGRSGDGARRGLGGGRKPGGSGPEINYRAQTNSAAPACPAGAAKELANPGNARYIKGERLAAWKAGRRSAEPGCAGLGTIVGDTKSYRGTIRAIGRAWPRAAPVALSRIDSGRSVRKTSARRSRARAPGTDRCAPKRSSGAASAARFRPGGGRATGHSLPEHPAVPFHDAAGRTLSRPRTGRPILLRTARTMAPPGARRAGNRQPAAAGRERKMPFRGTFMPPAHAPEPGPVETCLHEFTTPTEFDRDGPTGRLRAHPGAAQRGHARRRPLAGDLGAHRRGGRRQGRHPDLRGRGRDGQCRDLLLASVLPRGGPLGLAAGVLPGLPRPRRASPAAARAPGQQDRPRRRALQRAGAQDLAHVQRRFGAVRRPQRPDRAPRRTGALAHRVGDRRPRRPRRLVVVRARHDRPDPAPPAPVCAGAQRARRRPGPRDLRRRAPRQRPRRSHPPGPGRAHRRGERPGARAAAPPRRARPTGTARCTPHRGRTTGRFRTCCPGRCRGSTEPAPAAR